MLIVQQQPASDRLVGLVLNRAFVPVPRQLNERTGTCDCRILFPHRMGHDPRPGCRHQAEGSN